MKITNKLLAKAHVQHACTTYIQKIVCSVLRRHFFGACKYKFKVARFYIVTINTCVCVLLCMRWICAAFSLMLQFFSFYNKSFVFFDVWRLYYMFWIFCTNIYCSLYNSRWIEVDCSLVVSFNKKFGFLLSVVVAIY